jgi:hypothetical protein
MENQNNVGQRNVQDGSNPYIHRIADIHRIRPSKFGGSDKPIEVDY